MPKIKTGRTVNVKMCDIPAENDEAPSRRTLNEMFDDGKVVEDDAHKGMGWERCKGSEGPFCRPMASALHREVNSQKSGLTAMVADFPARGPDGQYFGVALVVSKGPTLVLNFCPWCGTNIRAVFPPESA